MLNARRIVFGCFIPLLLAACQQPRLADTFDHQYLQGLADTHYHAVEADRIGRTFHVYVGLPSDYPDSRDDYPVVYVLDGGSLFPLFASYSRYLQFGEDLPPAIIVGISYPGLFMKVVRIAIIRCRL